MRTFLFTLLLAASASAQDRRLHWDRYDVEARLDVDGVLHVVETLDYVFTGDWNGGERRFRTRLKERVALGSIERIGPGGERIPLRKDGDVDDVDEYKWSHPNLRWRARLPSDPPFAATPLRYRIEYSLRGAVDRTGNGYLFDFDLAPSDLAGPIELLTWNLELDPEWRAVSEKGRRSGSLRDVRPGQHVTVTLELAHAGESPPGAVAVPSDAGFAVAGMVLLLALGSWSIWSYFRDERKKGRFEPIESIDTIDRGWLEQHVFRNAPEVIGAAWDEDTGSAEVAAVLARMVQEKKLTSRVEQQGRWSSPVLHLELLVPRDSLQGYERRLINGLFFSGNQTDTKKIRAHYRKSKKGFDPASKIKKPLARQVDEMVRVDKAPSGWRPQPAIIGGVLGIALIVTGSILGSMGDVVVAAAFGGGAVALLIFGILAASVLQKRVASFAVPATFVSVVILLMIASFIAPVTIWRDELPAHPLTIAGLALLIWALIDIVLAVARYRQSAGRMELRRNLWRAREWFARELKKPTPALDDAWFPYLLAFGLGGQIDRWFHSFGTSGVLARTSGPSLGSSGSGSSSWSGGGGHFGGAGASGAWGVAAASLGAGVAAASSGRGGRGGGSSGGGGAGGW